ncbi:hypothetical protein [Streptomyces sp. NPDC018711]|uniref:hypothetical protein n=1 Tax=Streptomyces sp. NPDC018711 TaxID=3365052 RepID=UPI0037943F5E
MAVPGGQSRTGRALRGSRRPRDEERQDRPGPWIRLPLDTGGTTAVDTRAQGRPHWAPLFHDGYADRVSALAGWLGRIPTASRRP